MNQCDGCLAGYPIKENGTHEVPYPSGPMKCQKVRYEAPDALVKGLQKAQDRVWDWLEEDAN